MEDNIMANAAVYARFKVAGAGWNGPFGEGSSTMSDRARGADNSGTHAERVAWRAAIDGNNRGNLNAWYDGANANFPGLNVQIKIAVDQLICPSCQAWLAKYVLDDVRTLTASARSVEVLIEVTSGGRQRMMGLGRTTKWADGISHGAIPDLALAGDH
jgi:hypothetical protein